MHCQKSSLHSIFAFLFFLLSAQGATAQMITGVWHGKIDKQRVEVKIIQNGDSLTGTSYYYESPTRYRRYTIKGYFDADDNSAVWWDDQLLEDKTKGLSSFSKNNMDLARADFNCPGGGVMKLDGKTYKGQDQQNPGGEVHLDKVVSASFNDEWDFVIENYTLGANNPDVIDSISMVAKTSPVEEKPIVITTENKPETISIPAKKEEPLKKELVASPVNKPEIKIDPLTIEQKFSTREKIFNSEIPVTGDSIELRFYDNAEVDGDSISLFLNGKLIFEHIGLTEKAYVVKLAVTDLGESNELTMVAENLGSIPPNTSYMVALVGDKRYDARLASTENSSAMIRLTKAMSREP
jgi:hypothetical protein